MPVTSRGSPTPVSTVAVNSRLKVPSPRLPVFRPVTPPSPSSVSVFVRCPGPGRVMSGVAAMARIVEFAAASCAMRRRSLGVLTFRGLMPVGSTRVVPVRPSRARNSWVAARKALRDP